MSREELDLLQEYQRTCACETETDIDLIADTIDRLTTNGKTRDGRTIIRKHRNEIVQTMKKLHDLFVEVIEPAECDCCGEMRILSRCWTGALETWACDKCRGMAKEAESEQSLEYFNRFIAGDR